MSCTLVFDNGKSSGWERKGSTVASGNPVFFKHKYVPSKFIYVKKSTYRPFYRYGGHIEFIILKEYYGMPRGHSLSIYAGFLGKMRTSRIVYR